MYYKIGITLLIVVVAFFAYNQFVNILERNAELSQQMELQQQIIRQQSDAMTRQADNIRTLSRDLVESQQRVDSFMQVFSRNDLEALSYARPGLIERRVNDATALVLEEIERETAN